MTSGTFQQTIDRLQNFFYVRIRVREVFPRKSIAVGKWQRTRFNEFPEWLHFESKLCWDNCARKDCRKFSESAFAYKPVGSQSMFGQFHPSDREREGLIKRRNLRSPSLNTTEVLFDLGKGARMECLEKCFLRMRFNKMSFAFLGSIRSF